MLEVYFSGTNDVHLEESEGADVTDVGDRARLDISGALVFEIDGSYHVVHVISTGGATDVDPAAAQVELAQLAVTSLA